MRKVGLVILAAGGSSRMGEPKQLLQWDGRSLLWRAAETALASACRPVVVVLGSQAERMREELSGLPIVVVENADWASGMGGSIRCGVAQLAADSRGVDAAVLMLCDQPLVTAAVLQRLVAVYRASGTKLVACDYGDAIGPPALFDRSLFAELLELEGGTGAKSVIARHRDEAAFVAFPEGRFDIDTPFDYKASRGFEIP